jgi:hypothetical protein
VEKQEERGKGGGSNLFGWADEGGAWESREGVVRVELWRGGVRDLVGAISSLQVPEEVVESLLCCWSTMLLLSVLLLLLLWRETNEVIEVWGLRGLWWSVRER